MFNYIKNLFRKPKWFLTKEQVEILLNSPSKLHPSDKLELINSLKKKSMKEINEEMDKINKRTPTIEQVLELGQVIKNNEEQNEKE